MNEFRKSFNDPNRGMTIRKASRGEETRIIDSMANKPVASEHFGATDKITVEFETITPQRAQADLDFTKRNLKNRNVKPRPLARIVHAMKTKQFREDTGETLKYDSEGNVLDGQHRLMGIVESGVTLRLLVARNVPSAARGTMDGVTPRSIGDNFGMLLGVTNGNRMAAAVKMFYMLTTGKYPDLLTFEDCAEIYENNRETFEWMGKAFSNNTMFDNAVIAGAVAVAYRYAPNSITNFADQLHTGLDMSKGSPVAALRSAIINIKTGGKGRNNFGTITDRYRFALKVLRAASLYLEGKTIVGPSNLYATPLGLRYFDPDVKLPNFMSVDEQNS